MATSEEIKIIVTAAANKAIKDFKKLNNTMDNTGKSTKKTQKSMSGMSGKFLKIAAAAAAVGIAINKAFDLAKTGAKFQQSMEAMETQFGINAEGMLAHLRNVSDGTISDFNLIEAANRAMALNVTSNLDEMGQLMEIARVRARAMGTDTTDAFNDIVTGIGRGSPLMLDNLGIITKGWNEEAKAAGKAYDAQFILNKVLQQGAVELEKVGEVVLTDAEKFQRMEASIENMKVKLGQALLPVMAAIANKVVDVIEYFQNWDIEMDRLGKRFGLVIDQMLGGLAWFASGALTAFGNVAQHFTDVMNFMIEKSNEFFNTEFEQWDNYLLKAAETLEAEIITTEEASLRKQEIEEEYQAAILEKELEQQANIAEARKQGEKKRTKNTKKTQDKDSANYLNWSTLMAKYDANYYKMRAANRGLDIQNYQNWSNFIMGSMDKSNKTQFKIYKAFAIQQALIATHQAAIEGYKAMVGIPIVGPALGAAAAAVAVAAGMMRVNMIRKMQMPQAQEGGLIPGSLGGTALIAGEQNKAEAIIPLENEEAQEKLGGFGGVTNINLNVETLIADEELPREIAENIDAALYQLQQDRGSRI